MITETLCRYLNEKSGRNLILFKNEDELLFLNEWLKQESHTATAVSVEKDIDLVIDSCSKCGSVISRKKAYGSGKNGLMIILNSPKMLNRIEISIHKSESSVLLKKMINAIGLDIEDCYITNLVKCETSDIMLKPSEMVNNCMDVLSAEIEKKIPRAILVMGEILPLQDLIHKSSGISWFNTDHTISLIKNPGLKKNAWETLKILKQKLQEADI